jgi:hypothetical protein
MVCHNLDDVTEFLLAFRKAYFKPVKIELKKFIMFGHLSWPIKLSQNKNEFWKRRSMTVSGMGAIYLAMRIILERGKWTVNLEAIAEKVFKTAPCAMAEIAYIEYDLWGDTGSVKIFRFVRIAMLLKGLLSHSTSEGKEYENQNGNDDRFGHGFDGWPSSLCARPDSGSEHTLPNCGLPG